jgi:hypothetical protein
MGMALAAPATTIPSPPSRPATFRDMATSVASGLSRQVYAGSQPSHGRREGAPAHLQAHSVSRLLA